MPYRFTRRRALVALRDRSHRLPDDYALTRSEKRAVVSILAAGYEFVQMMQRRSDCATLAHHDDEKE